MGQVMSFFLWVVDIVDTFRLQEQPAMDKKQFVTFMKGYIKLLTPRAFEEAYILRGPPNS
ncbi:unnamed protein product [Prunus armeniaca]|uniref:TCTP domain-containing protein n=1 Tax=Prunus armeniaca TaxID=36596 RepID=A0A6J5XP33_PRUAR|nr:unnamed protein product [Prunus armeniaca]